jgi:hypothetical protein
MATTGVGVTPPTDALEQAERNNIKTGMIVLLGFIISAFAEHWRL